MIAFLIWLGGRSAGHTNPKRQRENGMGACVSRSVTQSTTHLLLILIILGLNGCSRIPNVVPVSGKVTVDGQPLANVAINFGPLTGGMDGAYAAYGKTDAQGRFTLKLVDNGQPGATVGKNRVTLNESSDAPVSDGAAAKVQFKLPPTARDGTLQFDVPTGGTDSANFDFPVKS
jgi:hypothetical protein